eukprot:scaffold15356_cov122-Isochrysis_galbana.AAC.2
MRPPTRSTSPARGGTSSFRSRSSRRRTSGWSTFRRTATLATRRASKPAWAEVAVLSRSAGECKGRARASPEAKGEVGASRRRGAEQAPVSYILLPAHQDFSWASSSALSGQPRQYRPSPVDLAASLQSSLIIHTATPPSHASTSQYSQYYQYHSRSRRT